MRNLLGVIIATLCLSAMPLAAHAAKPVKTAKVNKERLVLMPLRVVEENQSMQGAMETALVQGLQEQYEVFAGQDVKQKTDEIFHKESKKKNCDETRCMEDIATAFQAELVATANVAKIEGGYLLALSIRNVMDNKAVYSNSLPCKGCDPFQVVEKLKELAGTSSAVAVAPPADDPQPKATPGDPEGITWAEAQKGNTLDDYQVYLDTYPKGKYIPFAKAKIKKLKEAQQAAADQQEQQAWDAAQQKGSEDAYNRYLKGYPSGRFAGFAKSRLNKLQTDVAAKEEAAAWQTAQTSEDSKTVQGFMDRYPASSHLAAAQKKLATIYSYNANGMKARTIIRLPSRAALGIEIFGAGEHQMPVAVIPFGGDVAQAQAINEVVVGDLQRTGLFRLVDPAGKSPHKPEDVSYPDWQVRGADALAIGSIANSGNGLIEVHFRLMDVVRQTELVGQAVSANTDQVRAIGHRIADIIYEKLTGDKGVFSTRIAYVNRQEKRFSLIVSDSDGFNQQVVLAQNMPIMSPAWSPDGSHLAYVSFEPGHAVAYVQSLYKNQRMVLADYPGSTSAPAWSPDGKQLAIVMTRDGGSHIYLVRPDGSDLRQITFNDGIDAEPNFSPDGLNLIFTSDRGGGAQIYQLPLNGGGAERLTYGEGGDFTPRYSKDGKSLVFSHRRDGQFYIATYDFQTKKMQVLADWGQGKNPSFSPNNKLILFDTEENGHGILIAVSRDGRIKQKISPQVGDIFDPIWMP